MNIVYDFEEFPFQLPNELNVLLFEDYLCDRLNLLRCLNKSFKNFIDDLTKLNKTNDLTIYFESLSLFAFAQKNSIVLNQDTKIRALNKGTKLPYEFLYPLTQNLIIRLIQLDIIDDDKVLSQLIQDWPFAGFTDVHLSFLLESSDNVFDKFIHSSVGQSITLEQLSAFMKSEPKHKYNFRFQNVQRFERMFPSIDLLSVNFKFSSNFKFRDFIDFDLSTQYLSQIDFAFFVHDEPILIDVIQRQSLDEFVQYYSTLMLTSTQFKTPFQKVSSRLCLNMGWLEPFLITTTDMHLSLLSLHSGCRVPSSYSHVFPNLFHKMSNIDVLLFSDDDFYAWARNYDRKQIAISFLMLFSLNNAHIIPHKRFEMVLCDFVDNFEQTPFFLNFRSLNSIDFTSHRIRKIQIISSCNPTNESPDIWWNFFTNLDQIYQPENKENELLIFNEFVQSFKRSAQKLSLTFGDIEPLKHTELLPIYQQVLTLDDENPPRKICLIVKQIDEYVIDFLLNTLNTSERQLKYRHIVKIKSPKVFIHAWNNNFLQPGDQMPLFLVNCFILFLRWDRVDLISYLLANPCIRSWLESFLHVIPPVLLKMNLFSGYQIEHFVHCTKKMLKIE
jgi:hypothetical protein